MKSAWSIYLTIPPEMTRWQRRALLQRMRARRDEAWFPPREQAVEHLRRAWRGICFKHRRKV